MVSVAELVLLISGKDEASKTIGGVKGALNSLEKPALAAGVAVTGLGIGVEALARSQQDSNIAVKQNAAALGITEGAYRDLALSISSAGLPLDDVNSLFTTARQEGITSGEELKKFAQFWDDVGDATGIAGTDLAQAATGLRAVGIAAGDEGKALAAFGFITDHTKIGVDDFLSVLTKKGADIKAFGMNIDDTAAVLAAMEKELGLTGKAASAEFVSAMDKSDGTLNGLLTTLGISKEGFTTLRGQVDQSSGVIERNAAIQDASITTMQRWQNKVKEVAFEHAGLIKGLSDLAPIMVAAGPTAKIVTMALGSFGQVTKIAAAAQWLLNAAMLANPAVLIVVGIVALVAILVVLEMKFGLVSKAVEWLTDAFWKVLGFMKDNWPEIATLILLPFAPLLLVATDAFGIRSKFIEGIQAILDKTKEIVAGIKKAFTDVDWESIGKNAMLGVLKGITGVSLAQAINNKLPGGGVGGAVGGALGKVGLRADGGPVSAGRPYIVGENGPELFVPRNGGNIVPNGGGGGGFGGLTVNFNGPVSLGGEKSQLQTVGFAVATTLRARGVPFLP